MTINRGAMCACRDRRRGGCWLRVERRARSGMSGQSTGSSTAPAPSQAFGPTYAEGVIEKKAGEPAGLNCPDDSEKPCDLNFTVTAIQQGAPCDAAERPGADQQARVVVRAPKPAEKLGLSWRELKWEWPVLGSD